MLRLSRAGGIVKRDYNQILGVSMLTIGIILSLTGSYLSSYLDNALNPELVTVTKILPVTEEIEVIRLSNNKTYYFDDQSLILGRYYFAVGETYCFRLQSNAPEFIPVVIDDYFCKNNI